MDDSTRKICVRCGETKPRTEFHKRAKARDGLNPACKVCICAERRAYAKKNRARETEYARRYRSDPTSRERYLKYMQDWREANQEHCAEYARKHYAENRKRYAAWGRAWFEAHREEVLARQAADVDGMTAAKLRRYREANREVLAERARKRQAIYKHGVEVGLVDLDALWTGLCGICGKELDRSLTAPDLMRKSIDHIWPISRGGAHAQENLQWAHLLCNISKGATVPDL